LLLVLFQTLQQFLLQITAQVLLCLKKENKAILSRF